MPLQIEIHSSSNVPLEVEGILPTVVRDKSLAEIEKLPIFQGNRKLVLADFFRVTGDPTDLVMEWQGDLTGVHWLGTKLTAGKIIVPGSVGRHVGSEMRGGEILVHGNVGDWVGAEMHGGLIHVHGNAGHLVGAAYRGSAKGMTKGTILVRGNAGNEIGHSMRRGLIAIGGNIGDLAGINMLAGNIFVFGTAGIRHGAGMKRGTIGFFGSELPSALPTFRRACRLQPEFLQLLFRQLQQFDFPVPAELFATPIEMFIGDIVTGGRGELLLRAG